MKVKIHKLVRKLVEKTKECTERRLTILCGEKLTNSTFNNSSIYWKDVNCHQCEMKRDR